MSRLLIPAVMVAYGIGEMPDDMPWSLLKFGAILCLLAAVIVDLRRAGHTQQEIKRHGVRVYVGEQDITSTIARVTRADGSQIIKGAAR